MSPIVVITVKAKSTESENDHGLTYSFVSMSEKLELSLKQENNKLVIFNSSSECKNSMFSNCF